MKMLRIAAKNAAIKKKKRHVMLLREITSCKCKTQKAHNSLLKAIFKYIKEKSYSQYFIMVQDVAQSNTSGFPNSAGQSCPGASYIIHP